MASMEQEGYLTLPTIMQHYNTCKEKNVIVYTIQRSHWVRGNGCRTINHERVGKKSH